MKNPAKKWLARTLLIVLGLWLCFLGYIAWAMRQPPEVFGRVMSRMPGPAFLLFPFETMWTEARSGRLSLGDAAPGISVRSLERKAPVPLSSLWVAKPIVLVFGSYT